MSYYKYAERDASAEVNWAQIGQNLSQTLQDEVKVREEKKAAIDAATREYDITLNSAPQGEFQDGNKFTNEYVAAQQKTRMMDDALLKSGRMDLKTYTTRRQNGIDGTNQLFDLQKNFQSVYSERMKGIMDGTLQAQNTFELMQVEGFGDFSKSQALINPVDGRVNIGMIELGPDGVKRVIPNSNIPVNVLNSKIGTAIPSYDVNAATKALVDSQGDRVFTLFQAGTIAGAGSITELTGVDAISKFGRGQWTEAAREMNLAISQSVGAMLQDPRHLTSVLTGQVGGYSAESFTYDRAVAEKDPAKILLKLPPNGGPGIMDETSPNYKEQRKQAEDYLTRSIKSQMDSKVGKSATAQAQETTAQQERAKATYRQTEPAPQGVVLGEVLRTRGNAKNNKVDGIAIGVENLVIEEAGGIKNFIKSIGYNNVTKRIEAEGYQTSGKESESEGTSAGGVDVKRGSNVAQQKNFRSNDLNNARLLGAVATKTPNPERPGYNFSNIQEMKNYFQREYKRTSGTNQAPATTNKPIQFDAEGNLIQ